MADQRTRGIVKKELEICMTKLRLDPHNETLGEEYVKLTIEFGKCCQGLGEFMRTYNKWLLHFRTTKPSEYQWDMAQYNEVCGRMFKAIQRGSYNKNSESIKATCKELGIPWTYKAIAEFIK